MKVTCVVTLRTWPKYTLNLLLSRVITLSGLFIPLPVYTMVGMSHKVSLSVALIWHVELWLRFTTEQAGLCFFYQRGEKCDYISFEVI